MAVRGVGSCCCLVREGRGREEMCEGEERKGRREEGEEMEGRREEGEGREGRREAAVVGPNDSPTELEGG